MTINNPQTKLSFKVLLVLALAFMLLCSALPVSADGGQKELRFHSDEIKFDLGGEALPAWGTLSDDGTTIAQTIPEGSTAYAQFFTISDYLKPLYRPDFTTQESTFFRYPDATPLRRKTTQFLGWADAPNSKEDVSFTLWDQAFTESKDFYTIWGESYIDFFHANGGHWSEPFGSRLEVPMMEGEVQPKFSTHCKKFINDQFTIDSNLTPPMDFLKFKGWYTSENEASAEFNFNEPATAPRDAYAHWTTELRIDVMKKTGEPNDNKYNIDGYTVKVTDQKNGNVLSGGFKAAAHGVNAPLDQWISDSKDLYIGDSLKLEFSDLPEGMKLAVDEKADLQNIAWVRPVSGQKNTFTVDMNKLATHASNYAYYARFDLVPEAQYRITVDPNGGVWPDGSSEPKTDLFNAGDVFTLPPAPSAENLVFDCWKGSRYNPGDEYVVTEDHDFVATWVPQDQDIITIRVPWQPTESSTQVVPLPAPTQAPSAPASVSVIELPKTGESADSYRLGSLMLALSGVMVLFVSKMKRR